MSGRHAPPRTGRRRTVPLLMTAATLFGLWFGIRAPDVSPVTPPSPGAQVQTVDDGVPRATDQVQREAGE